MTSLKLMGWLAEDALPEPSDSTYCQTNASTAKTMPAPMTFARLATTPFFLLTVKISP